MKLNGKRFVSIIFLSFGIFVSLYSVFEFFAAPSSGGGWGKTAGLVYVPFVALPCFIISWWFRSSASRKAIVEFNAVKNNSLRPLRIVSGLGLLFDLFVLLSIVFGWDVLHVFYNSWLFTLLVFGFPLWFGLFLYSFLHRPQVKSW